MSKFVIECPNCGKYAEAKTGFFARKRIDCSCGYTIHVRTDRISARRCPHCGNTVAFDQAKGAEARCPVCGTLINTLAEQSKYVEFSCARCGVRLNAVKGREGAQREVVCPVCDFRNDVSERLMAEKIRREGRASIVKFEGDSETLVWKHPVEDFNLGSQLIVHESQEAVFFRDGIASEPLGAGRYTLETQSLPMINSFYNPAENGKTFHSEVYFINKNARMAIRWGTPDKVRFIDPLTGVPLELGASGEMNLRVKDSRRLLLKLVGTMKGISWEDGPGMARSLQSSFRPLITTAVKANLSAVIKDNAIDLLEVDEKLELISQRLRDKLLPGFEDYGLTIPQFYVTNVVLPEEDPNFKRIRELHTVLLQTQVYEAEATVQTVKAQTEAQYKTAQARAKAQYRTAEEQSAAAIEAARRSAVLEQEATETEIARQRAERRVIAAQAEAQAAHMAGMTEAEVMAAKGYNQRDVIQAEVQKTYAGAMEKMGGSASGGMAGEMLGLGVGVAAAKAFAPKIGSFISGAPEDTAPAGGWECPSCGAKNIRSRFCPDCGAKKPEPKQAETWDCPACGASGIRSRFCPDCGARKPEAPKGWTCPNCGKTNIMSRFCPECGRKKDE